MDYYTLDDEGNPIAARDALSWARWMGEKDRRFVARDKIGAVEVSTVFLGFAHGEEDGAPILWESMIFGGPRDQKMERYTSRAAALEGHAALVARERGGST